MQFDTTYLTEVGRELATSTLGGLDKIQFTRAVASSHDYSATSIEDLKKLTDIEGVEQEVQYSRIVKKDKTTLTMRVDFPSKDVEKAYSLYTVGFYARLVNGDEVLYGVLPSSLPDYVPAYDGHSNINDSFQTDTTVSDTDNVMITVTQAGALNEDDLEAIFTAKHIATIEDIKSNLPDTLADTAKDNHFTKATTFDKAPTDADGNEYVNSRDTAGWQHSRVTADDGTSYIEVNAGEDMYAKIVASDMGFHTIYVNAAAENNPVKGIDSMRGTVYIDSNGEVWSADLTSFSGVSYHVVQKNSQTPPIVSRLVSADDAKNWQQQALFNAGSFDIGTATSDYRTYVESRFSKAGVYYVRLENAVDVDTNGTKVSVMDTHLISEGLGWYYAWGISLNGVPYYRRWSTDRDSGWKAGMSRDDVKNFQQTTITAPDGGNKYAWTTDSCPDLVAAIQALPMGYHTFYCQVGVKGNPSTDSIRGTAEITSSDDRGFFGVGNFTDNLGNAWSFFVDNTGWKLNQTATSDALETAIKKVLGETVRDNGDGSVTVNGVKMVPADVDHVVSVNEAGNGSKVNFDFGNLTVDQLKVLGFKVMYDTENYTSWAAAHPNALLIVLHATDTTGGTTA